MFWIAIAIVVVGYLWYRATTQNQALPQSFTPPRLPSPVPLQRDATAFRVRITSAFEAGDLGLVIAMLDQELRPALSDLAGATKALYGNTLTGAGRADRARAASETADHFATVARCMELLASKINGQQHRKPAAFNDLVELLSAETLDVRIGRIIDDVIEIGTHVDTMESIKNEPASFFVLSRKIRDASEHLATRLALLYRETKSLADNLELAIEHVGPDPSTFRDRFTSAFDSGDYARAAEVIEKEAPVGFHRAIRRAAELHDHVNGSASDDENVRRGQALLDAADHALDVATSLALLAATSADAPPPSEFTSEDSRSVLFRVGERMKEDGWGNLVVQAFLDLGKKWESALAVQGDAKKYVEATEGLRWHALECWIWAKLTMTKLEYMPES